MSELLNTDAVLTPIKSKVPLQSSISAVAMNRRNALFAWRNLMRHWETAASLSVPFLASSQLSSAISTSVSSSDAVSTYTCRQDEEQMYEKCKGRKDVNTKEDKNKKSIRPTMEKKRKEKRTRKREIRASFAHQQASTHRTRFRLDWDRTKTTGTLFCALDNPHAIDTFRGARY